MFRNVLLFAASCLVVMATCGAASAQGNFPAFTIADKAGNCLALKAPDQSDGGGLTVKPCQNFPDFFVTVAGSTGEVQLQFRLNSMRFVCILATSSPAIGTPAPVSTRNCPSSDPTHQAFWNVRGPDSNGFQRIGKLDSDLKDVNFCIQEDAQTAAIALEVCQGNPGQDWKLKAIP